MEQMLHASRDSFEKWITGVFLLQLVEKEK